VSNPPGHLLFDTQTCRAIEGYCLAQVAEGELVRRAARVLADYAQHLLETGIKGKTDPVSLSRQAAPNILVLSGPGYNGQDAKLTAELLSARGMACSIVTLPELEAMAQQDAGLQRFAESLETFDLLVDGLLGLGLSRPVSPALSRVFQVINASACPVLAIDLPSGLSADTGMALGAALEAHVTVTMLVDKVGLHTGEAALYCGERVLAPLGCEQWIAEAQTTQRWHETKGLNQNEEVPNQPPNLACAIGLDSVWLKQRIPTRAKLAHKGRQGAVLLIGGASGMRGALVLAALGAQAGGAGKVFLHFLGAQESDQFALASQHPSLMSIPQIDDWENALKDFDCVLIGCGLGRSPKAQNLLRHVIASCDVLQKPLVLDADALNLIAADPLEAGRLLRLSTAEVQSDRLSSAKTLSVQRGLSVILKGPGSIIVGPDAAIAMIAPPGSASLAVAGTGDVLAGLLAGLMAQGHPPSHAAALAACAHALGGTRWSLRHPKSIGMRAEQLIEEIVEVLNAMPS
jgi:ADP-dependent NAD(P)H-hydrate dehydratase / NAD(P)H-hydrate epimerase